MTNHHPKTMTVILAAGKQNGDFCAPKVLLPVDGETLLARNVRLAYSVFGDDVEVAVSDVALAREINCGVMLTTRTCGGCDTMVDTICLWESFDRVQVLLADVFYDQDSLKLMSAETRPIVFYCDTYETFAVQFRSSAYPAISKMMVEIAEKAHGKPKRAGFTHLWQRLHIAGRKPVKVFLPPPTQDFDCVADYTEFLSGRTKNKCPV